MDPAQANPVSVYGKLPGYADFVAGGARDAPEQLFESWLASAVEHAGGIVPRHAVRFVVAPEATPMIGLWVASRDRFARAFPLALTCRLPGYVSELPWTIVLGLYGAYLDAVESRLQLAAAEGGERVGGLERALGALPLPHPSGIAGALHEAEAALAAEPLRCFAARTLPGGGADGLPYALSALRRACASAQANERAGDPCPTLELPARSEFDLFAWLSLVRAELGPRQKPRAVFWSRGQGRVLLELHDPTPAALSYLLHAEDANPKRWPIWTARAAALRQARHELSVAVADLLVRDGTLAELARELTRERGS